MADFDKKQIVLSGVLYVLLRAIKKRDSRAKFTELESGVQDISKDIHLKLHWYLMIIT